MKEVRSPIELSPVRRISDDDLNRELFRAACYFHASSSLSNSEDEVGRIPALQLLAEHLQESEIVTSLLNSSIRIRLLDEQLWDKSNEIRETFAWNVGSLCSPADATDPTDLTLREACNKILHAEDIGFYVDDTQYSSECMMPQFLEPRIALYGSRGRTAWRAEVSIDRFVEAGYWLANYS